MILQILISVFILLCAHQNASPIPSINENSSNELLTLLNNIIESNLAQFMTVDQILDILTKAIGNERYTPLDISQINDTVANASTLMLNSSSPNILQYIVELLISGINPKSIRTSVAALTTYNSIENNNPILSNVINPNDPSFTVDEIKLRSAIYIPSNFTALNGSNLKAIVMVPGTGAPGGQVWAVSFAKKFVQDQIANPVWLNIPTISFQDAQITAEYVGYAVNYISQYTGGQNVSIIAFSQGNLNTQWALKYFPSVRKLVSDYIAISPDFRGTITAKILCPQFPRLPCPASILQQIYNSTFIRVLRQNGGDSEIVPTTTVFSAFDEIVQPQSGSDASGLLFNANNNLIQDICKSLPAGSFYTHEGMLYNPLSYALAVDALTHVGHANTSRMLSNNPGICLLPSTPGLSVDEILILESTVIVFALGSIVYFPKQFNEPPIQSYATY